MIDFDLVKIVISTGLTFTSSGDIRAQFELVKGLIQTAGGMGTGETGQCQG